MYNKTEEKTEKRIRQTLCGVVWLSAALFFYAAVIRSLFGGTIWDKAVYGLAAVLFAGLIQLWIGRISLA